jgi:hypothetical protein
MRDTICELAAATGELTRLWAPYPAVRSGGWSLRAPLLGILCINFGGVLPVLFGVLRSAQCGARALALVWGIDPSIFGVALLALAWRPGSVLPLTHPGRAGTHQTWEVSA